MYPGRSLQEERTEEEVTRKMYPGSSLQEVVPEEEVPEEEVSSKKTLGRSLQE